jgi:hypothetical protein
MCECGKAGKMRRGMCGACYARWLRQQPGSLRDNRTPVERFWAKVDKTESCWVWLGTGTPKGYGQFAPNRRHVYAHRYAYELTRGPIAEGMTIDHLCRNRGCVNPDHMEVVTRGENTRRADNRRTCSHCGASTTAQHLRRHVAAHHPTTPATAGNPSD